MLTSACPHESSGQQGLGYQTNALLSLSVATWPPFERATSVSIYPNELERGFESRFAVCCGLNSDSTDIFVVKLGGWLDGGGPEDVIPDRFARFRWGVIGARARIVR